jgi:membrane dipeptidase
VGIGTDWPLIPTGEGPQRKFAHAFNNEMGGFGFRAEHRIDWNSYTMGLEQWSNWPNITAGLLARGYSENEVRKIVGGNFLRLFENVVG